RRRHIHGHAILVADPGLEPLWRPTPYDGDFGFCLRPPPGEPRRSGVAGPGAGIVFRETILAPAGGLSAIDPLPTLSNTA
ncbi:MAG: hypothetical protein Q8O54_11980, partial [Brevundimonas sp.]|nr:hypothetical protein [Brevundimonas sp.]